MFYKERLDAKNFRNLKIDFSEPLPQKAVPFIWFFINKLRGPFVALFSLYFMATVIGVIEPVFFGQLVEQITESTGESLWKNVLAIVIGYILIVQVGGSIFWQMGHVIESRVMPLLTMLIRRYLAIYLQRQNYNFFQDNFAGQVAGKVMEMPIEVQDTMHDVTYSVLYTIVSAIIGVILFSYIHWILGLVTAILVVLYTIVMLWRIPEFYDCSQEEAASLQRTRGRFVDSISNMLTVKLFAREKLEDKNLTDYLMESGEKEQQSQWEDVILNGIQLALCAIFMVAIFLLCIYGYHQDFLSIGDVATALPLAALIVDHLCNLLAISTDFFGRFAVIQDALNTLVKSDYTDTDPYPTTDLTITNGEITFENVHFSHGTNKLFEGLSLTIPAKKKVAIVGLSGSGKTTLIQLLLRLFKQTEGKISIDGVDVSTVSKASLRDNISVIPQSAEMLHRTVFENISYSKPDATLEEVREAARKAHIDDIIMTMKDRYGNTGYDTVIGEKGSKMSQGQKQRVALARSFLKNTPILVLDEATTSLDGEGEDLIQQSLLEAMKDKTVIAIAHKLSTIADFDHIVVMHKGKIVEQGTHDELIEKDGVYCKLWYLQLEAFLDDDEIELLG